MADFDPDAFIAKSKTAESAPAFDPDAFIAKSENVHSSEEYEAPKTRRSALDVIARQGGLAGRAIISGITNVMDLPIKAVNAIPGVNPKNEPRPGFTEVYNKLFDVLGIAKPETSSERIASAAMSGMAGGVGMAGGAKALAGVVTNPVARGALTQMAAAPERQAASGATGGAASQTAEEAGAGPVGQAVAGVAGSLAPSVAVAGPAMATKRLIRGSDENIPSMQERAKTFKEAGAANPSVGQVTGSRTAQAFESALSKMPGGAGVMTKAAEKEAAEIGAKATEIADKLSTTASPATAGRAIEKGISGPDGFISRFKAGQKALYDKLDQYLPQQANVDVSNTKKTLAAMNSDIEGAPELSKWFKNARIQGIESSLTSDISGPAGKNPVHAAGGGSPTGATNVLPYEAVKKLRSLVGSELENGGIASDVPRSKWKALYASLSQDLDGAAAATGNKDAVEAMNRANRFTRAGHARIDDVLDRVIGKDKVPEAIYKAATDTGNMQAGATKIASVMKSLVQGERDVVKSAFIRKMGQATAGNQDAEGSVFSTQTFLTNWNKISPQAKAVLFSGKDGETRAALDAIAKSAEMIKTGSKIFSNPSGTGQALTAIGEIAGTASAVGGAIGTGHPITAAGILLGVGSGIGATNISARMMTNPNFVRWLAKSTKLSSGALPSAITSLQRVHDKQDEGVKADIENYLDSVSANLSATGQGIPK